MKTFQHGMIMAAREHLLDGNPITRLEAIVLFGVPNLPDVIKDMRKKGWIVQSRKVPYARAVRRVNEYAALTPPPNLPISEIKLTEYWVSK